MSSDTQILSSRVTTPDPVALLAAVRAALSNDASIGIGYSLTGFTYRVKRASDTPFSGAEIVAAKAAIDAAPALTPQRAAQNEIDNWPIAVKALALALIDQLNVIRAALPTPLAAITPAQALAAVRAKAGTL